MRKKVNAVLSVLISLYCTTAFAFSVADISDFSGDDAHTTRLVKVLRELAEPSCAVDSLSDMNSYMRDSVRLLLHSALDDVQGSCSEKNRYQDIMVKGLAWHYLNRLGAAAGFRKADSLATCAMNCSPSYPDGAWLKGVNLITSARISDGFRILDSLRADAEFDGPRFLSEYASLSAACFLPRNIRETKTVVNLKAAPSDMLPVFFGESETSPSQTGWSVHSPIATKSRVPIFTFTAEFSLGRQFNLVLPSPGARSKSTFTMNIRPDIVRSIPSPAVDDPFKPMYSTRFTIAVEPTFRNEPLPEYVQSLITDRYDVVVQKHELEKLGAISLRCHTRSAFSDVSGYEYAIVAFDRTVREDSLGGNNRCKKTAGGKRKYMKIRYVIAMESRSAVKDKSELLLQNILTNFEAFD